MQRPIFEQWTADIKSVEGWSDDQEQIGYEQGYLRYLHFSFTVITGGRFYSVGPNHQGVPSEAMIIAACLQEAYELGEHGAGEDLMDSRCYGFEM